MAEYFCPNCGAVLNKQAGFNPADGLWSCLECGMLLMSEETYENEILGGIAWFCDNCGELLNSQDGFSDINGWWRCTKCGCINGTTETEIVNANPTTLWPLT